MQMFDCHTHSIYSHDGKVSHEEQCQKAVALGLRGIAITDHNYPPPRGFGYGENIEKSVMEANCLKEKLGEKLILLSGIEIADMFLNPKGNDVFYRIPDVDFMLGSVHSAAVIQHYFSDSPVRTLLGSCHLIDLDFARRFMEVYLREVYKTAEQADVDAIAHLTYPLRYINGEADIGLCIQEFFSMIDEILDQMIKRELALEVNTSGLARGWNEFMPPTCILERYYERGGRIITIGSDAHKTEQLGVGILETINMLKDIGFTHGSYFTHRKRREYKL